MAVWLSILWWLVGGGAAEDNRDVFCTNGWLVPGAGLVQSRRVRGNLGLGGDAIR